MKIRKSTLVIGAVLSALLIHAAGAFAQSGGGLLAYWPFDEGSGPDAFDATGNGFDGTVYGATWVAGVSGTALEFERTSEIAGDYVATPFRILDFAQDTELTVTLWFKTISPEVQDFMGYYAGSSADIFTPRLLPPNHTRVGMRSIQPFKRKAVEGESCVAMNDGNWHHIAFTHNAAGEFDIYLDAFLLEETILEDDVLFNFDQTKNWYLGAVNDTQHSRPSNPFDGALDEVKIYDYTLSAEEIAAEAALGGINTFDDPCGISMFLLIDEDSLDKGAEAIEEVAEVLGVDPAELVNEDIADKGNREPLGIPVGTIVGNGIDGGTAASLMTGEVGDEGWFALKTIPESWAEAGSNADGLRNYVLAGPGLGTGNDPEALLDKIPEVTPLRTAGLETLVGQRVCALVYKSDISINYDPLEGNLQGATRGLVAFVIIAVGESSDSLLPDMTISILDADSVCGGPLALYLDAPVPISSSEPSP